MTVQLIGIATADPTSYSTGYNGLVLFFKFTASASGTLSAVNVKSYGNSVCKVAVYADNAGEPGARLAKQDTSTSVAEGWNTVNLEASCSVVNGTSYWLAIAANDSLYYKSTTSGPARRYKAVTYSTYTAPDPAGTGFTSDTNNTIGIQGWGTAGSTITPSAIASTLAFGTARLTLFLLPSGKSTGLIFGSVILKLYLLPSGRAGTMVFGIPSITSGITINPPGRISTVIFGLPTLKYNQVLHPSPRASAVAFGTPSLSSGSITVVGIVSIVAFGVPTVARFVFHIILEASYFSEASEINRVYVAGSDVAGAEVSGSAITQADVDLVGERLDAHHDPAVYTAAIAAAVAAAQLAKARLDGKRAIVIIPFHCGVELWDVVTCTDIIANQAANYRVSGYVMDYDIRQGTYLHTIDLCAP